MIQVLIRLMTKYSRIPVSGNKIKFIIMFAAIFWYASSGYLFFELQTKPDLNWGDALWWAMVTMTTVGYGDLFPVTAGGRYLVAVPAMIFGIGFLGFIISETATRFIEARSRRARGMSDYHGKGHIIIINFNREDELITLVEELKIDSSTKDRDICLVDEELTELPPLLAKQRVHFVKGNPTEEEVLTRANLQDASYCIILSRNKNDSHSDDQNLVTTLVVEKLNPEVFTVVEIIDARKVNQVKLTGADSVVCVSGLRSNLIIQELQDHGVMELVEQLTCNRMGQQIYVVPIKTDRPATYAELVTAGIAGGFTVIGIYRNEKNMVNCKADENIFSEDKAIIIAEHRVSSINL